jgi:hypothetical protein
MPHLISDSIFQPNRSDKAGIPGNPIPNAFMATGLASGGSNSVTASACAQANPLQTYSLAIPHAFVSITFTNQAKWYVDNKMVNQTSYGNEPDEIQQGVKHYKLKTNQFLDGFASLGNEYQAGNLWMLYNIMPKSNQSPMQKMLQRIQEIQPTFTMAQLQTLMMQCQLSTAPSGRYLIYPTYKSADCTNPVMAIGAVGSANIPGWLQQVAVGDGDSKAIATESLNQQQMPNRAWCVINPPPSNAPKWALFSGVVDWVPGTGFQQCLGELRFARVTSCYYFSPS